MAQLVKHVLGKCESLNPKHQDPHKARGGCAAHL